MRSMTGYGRGEVDHGGVKFTVELNSVNRKQSDIVLNLPRDFTELEPRIRQTINENLSRGRTTVLVSCEQGANGNRKLALDSALARSYHDAMRALQSELSLPGEITIAAVLQAPGVMRFTEEHIDLAQAWPALEEALATALSELLKMREREGNHLADDLRARLETIRQAIEEVVALFPEVVKKYRSALLERIKQAGLELSLDDERLLKEVAIFADRSDVSEELTRLESHLAQFAEH
ncbi:MAG TPA: YicC/YloC family endoribonuclease, partial [Chthoniobacterales bacterium]|nr:YicC/YloC family endoribonuclease [Chthoniobacterales bacterium]